MTGVSTVPPQVSDTWRRLSGAPNWPLVSACLLALAAIVELRLRTAGLGDLSSDWEVGLQFALVSTLPVALRRTRYLPVALAIVTLANSVQLAGTEEWTVAAIAAELWLLYETSLRYSRWLWIGACFALLVGALSSAGSNQAVIFPDGSADTGPSAPPGEIVILLAVGVSLLGDARRLRSHTIVERDEARESAAASQHEQVLPPECEQELLNMSTVLPLVSGSCAPDGHRSDPSITDLRRPGRGHDRPRAKVAADTQSTTHMPVRPHGVDATPRASEGDARPARDAPAGNTSACRPLPGASVQLDGASGLLMPRTLDWERSRTVDELARPPAWPFSASRRCA